MKQTNATFSNAMTTAVATGLASEPKRLPSWLFYDAIGDELFRQIMRMPAYYPTRCEYDILQQYKDVLRQYFAGQDSSGFCLIELGAGDGLKTEILLKHFLTRQVQFTYAPVDISAHAVTQLSHRLAAQLPGLDIRPLNKTYDEALEYFRDTEGKKVILFMGANIGNFTVKEATQFLKKLSGPMGMSDMLMIGFDLMKDPRVILEAYDDPDGLTARFNLNILTRLNRELGATFDLNNFSHFPAYDPQSGTTRSFLVSRKTQDIYIEALGRPIHFNDWEPVQTEVSQKYDQAMIARVTASAGLEIMATFFDRENYFCDVLVRTAR